MFSENQVIKIKTFAYSNEWLCNLIIEEFNIEKTPENITKICQLIDIIKNQEKKQHAVGFFDKIIDDLEELISKYEDVKSNELNNGK